MLNLQYALVIEATGEPDFFSFFSPDLEGFTGVGRSVEDCIHQAKGGMLEHVEVLKESGLPVPSTNPDARITIQNEAPMAVAA